MAGPEFGRTPPDQFKLHQEAGNDIPGIPPNLNERAKPPPVGASMREVVLERLDRELARRREGQLFPTTDEGMLAWNRQTNEVRKEVVASLTSEERALYEIEYLIEEPFSSYRVTMIESKQPELLDTMQQLDPKFMDPIITGLQKRPAREAKRARSLQRLFPNLNEEQIRQIRIERAILHLQRKVDRDLPPSER